MSVEFSQLFDKVLCFIDESLFDEYGKEGIYNHLLKYVHRVSADKITDDEDGKVFISEDLLTNEYTKKYLEKDKCLDFGVKDCAVLALVYYKAPPQEYMSIGSLEKKIRDLFKKQKGHVYIKRSSGKGNAVCVDIDTARKLILHPDVSQLIQVQTKKAENNHDDSVVWRAYEFTKKKVEFIESQSMEEDANEYSGLILTDNQKTDKMVKVLFNTLFTPFDFEKYEKYCDEIDMLDESWDFGERYQTLYDILNAPDYNHEFYTVKPNSELLDVLADKIAEKIIKKMGVIDFLEGFPKLMRVSREGLVLFLVEFVRVIREGKLEGHS